mgnify:CR=1 FL=1
MNKETYARVAGPAVRKVRHAVRTGRLVRVPCIECGEPKVQAHHPRGYDDAHALDVEWLCGAHHRVRHGRTAARPTWRREGLYAYMDRTRPADRHRHERVWQFSNLTGPPRLLAVLEVLWGMFVTDEEREHALAVIERLNVPEEKSA